MPPNTLPERVRAIFHPDIHTTDLILTDLPLPVPKDDEHLVKVYATAICAGELLWDRDFPSLVTHGKTRVPCYDLAGVVVTAPAGSPFGPGAEVYAHTDAHSTGHAREYSTVATSDLALKPKNVSWEEAAAVPLSALTAYQALFQWGGLRFGTDSAASAQNSKKRVLITAAAGGVGVWAVQLAKAVGVKEIIAVCGTSNVEFVKALGATEVIDYKKQTLGAWAAAADRKPDVILDMVGGQTLSDAWYAIKQTGKLISVHSHPERCRPAELSNKYAVSLFFILEPRGWELEKIAGLIEAGEAKAVVDSVWKLEQFKEAFAKVETGHARGKVVIKVC